MKKVLTPFKLLGCILVTAGFLVAGVVAMTPAVSEVTSAGTSVEEPLFLSPLDQRSEIYDHNGSLLATLYGALIANAVCLPIADKLHVKMEEEDVSRSLIIDGVLLLRDAKSPSLIKEMLVAYLPEHARAELAEAA